MRQKKEAPIPSRKGFLDFLDNETERQRAIGHIGLSTNYHSASNSFSHFLKTRERKDVSFAELTSQLITDYEAWLQQRGLCRNTTSFYMRIMQAVYHKAVRQGLTNDHMPFVGVYRGVAKTVKRAINPKDVCRLKNLNLRASLVEMGYTGKQLKSLQRKLEFTRDIFLFSFCARGLTFVDLAYLQKSNVQGGMLVYVRRKTKQRIEVQVEPMMQEIIDRHPSATNYLLPILTQTDNKEAIYRQYRCALAQYNTHLGMLGELLGGLKLTSYVSRHSWATAAHQQNVPLSVICQSMGHDSEKTTEIYLKSLEYNVINKINHDLLANIFRESGEQQQHPQSLFPTQVIGASVG